MIFCRLNVTQWVSHYHINQTSLQSLVPAAVCELAGTVHNKTDSVGDFSGTALKYNFQVWWAVTMDLYFVVPQRKTNNILY